MSEMVLAHHSRRKKKSYRSHSWHEGAKPYFTVFSTSKHIVAEMHEAFAHLVNILVVGELPKITKIVSKVDFSHSNPLNKNKLV